MRTHDTQYTRQHINITKRRKQKNRENIYRFNSLPNFLPALWVIYFSFLIFPFLIPLLLCCCFRCHYDTTHDGNFFFAESKRGNIWNEEKTSVFVCVSLLLFLLNIILLFTAVTALLLCHSAKIWRRKEFECCRCDWSSWNEIVWPFFSLPQKICVRIIYDAVLCCVLCVCMYNVYRSCTIYIFIIYVFWTNDECTHWIDG